MLTLPPATPEVVAAASSGSALPILLAFVAIVAIHKSFVDKNE